MMTKTFLFHALGYACLAFSVIGFVDVGLEFFKAQAYTLLRALIYCLVFGVGLALLI